MSSCAPCGCHGCVDRSFAQLLVWACCFFFFFLSACCYEREKIKKDREVRLSHTVNDWITKTVPKMIQ